MNGVSWVGSPHVVTSKDFIPLKNIHSNWIVQTPFGWQKGINSPEVHLSVGDKYYWGESDTGLIETNKLALKDGIKTLLKPHIWLTKANGKWRSDIKMNSEEEWDKWFSSYETFIIHYAKLAEKGNFEALSIGTELHQTILLHPEKWRKIIKSIRSVYKGKLTYAGNWYKEFSEVTFWDDLDYIGVQGYFPLTKNNKPNLEELNTGWKKYKDELKALSQKYNKPVIFTEIGYKSTSDAAIEPWLWPKRSDLQNKTIDFNTQKIAYEAVFQTFWNEPWVKGVFFWKWFPDHQSIKGKRAHGFTPQHKPAEKVIKKWFSK